MILVHFKSTDLHFSCSIKLKLIFLAISVIKVPVLFNSLLKLINPSVIYFIKFYLLHIF